MTIPNIDFKVMIFSTSNNSKTVRDRAIVATAEYKVVSIDGTTFNDLERPLTQI